MTKASKNNVSSLRKLQLIELDILKEVVKICKKNNLKYFLNGGTFLGAVRHKGFIPWDDDIDITMPRPDYEKFMEIAPKQLKNNLVFKNFKLGNEKTIYFSRVENSKIQIRDTSAIVHRVRNAWIDIFPLDGMPNNVIIRQIHKFVLLYRKLLLQYSLFSIIVNQDLPNRPFHEKVLIKIGQIFNFEKILDSNKCLYKLDKAMRRYDYNKSKYIVNFMSAYRFREMFEKTVFDDCIEYQFETEKLNAPRDYDKMLTKMYGEYMKLPPEEHRNKHHSEVINIDGDKDE